MVNEDHLNGWLESLQVNVGGQTAKVLTFEEYLGAAAKDPQIVFRDIFQLFYDMVKSNIVKGEDEYPGDPESIGFVPYDCSRIFSSEGADHPFFPDRLLANRFATGIETLKRGVQQNKIYVYIGPPGSGKSTFLNNLLRKFERYVNENGRSYEILWDIDSGNQKFGFSCPSHDYPILLIPREYRAGLLERLLSKAPEEVRRRITEEKEYEWLLNGQACTICESLFRALCERFGFDQAMKMVRAKPYRFDRRVGEGISIFNPGDQPLKQIHFVNQRVQDELDALFGANVVRYVYSQFAHTNNGVYVIADVKSHNLQRLLDLHNIVSEGVHKVDGTVEEQIKTLFFALMNPEDKRAVEEKNVDSLVARINYDRIPFVMEVGTEVAILRNVFGDKIDTYFLPGVLNNFARAIIASRMKTFGPGESNPLNDWIPQGNMEEYAAKHYCDATGLLLRMEIYSGVIPTWIKEADKKSFTAQRRRDLITAAAEEGDKGIDGRNSIRYFGDFLTIFGPAPDEPPVRLITIANIATYFKTRIPRIERDKYFPPKGMRFFDALTDAYDYAVLNEVKEALYFYNKAQIREDILHYLCAINYDPDGRKVKCHHTGKEIEVTVEFLKLIGSYIQGGGAISDRFALKFAVDVQKRYVVEVVHDSSRDISETELFRDLFDSYVRNLKENALKPFVDNVNFREAIKVFGTKSFETFDDRIRESVSRMIKNLIEKFGYTEQGAKEVCLYVIDQKLVQKFPS